MGAVDGEDGLENVFYLGNLEGKFISDKRWQLCLICFIISVT